MRNLILFILVLLAFNGTAQDTLLQSAAVQPVIRIRSGSFLPANDYLLIVDGILRQHSYLKGMEADDIQSIDILKRDTSGLLFICNTYKDVVIIKTKSATTRKFIVKDKLSGKPVEGATVEFSQDNHAVIAIADAKGIITASDLEMGKEYAMKVTAVGYKELFSVSMKVKPGKETLLMERDIKKCGEVIMVGYTHTIRCHRLECGSICKKKTQGMKSVAPSQHLIDIYPNPVRKGETITVSLQTLPGKQVQVLLLGSDGRLLQIQKNNAKAEKVFIRTDSRWSAGVYFIQLTDEQGQVLGVERLIVQ